MENISLENIQRDILLQYQNQWIAISKNNQVIANGSNYSEVVKKLSQDVGVALLKIPPLNLSLAPKAYHEV